jgi:hypothetical protein
MTAFDVEVKFMGRNESLGEVEESTMQTKEATTTGSDFQ